MPYEVTLQQVAPRPIAAVRGRATAAELPRQIIALSRPVWEFLRRANIKSDGHNIVIYWDEPGKDLLHSAEGVPIEVGAGVLSPFAPAGEIICSATPGGVVATTAHIGPYDRLHEAHAAIHKWCRENGHAPAGVNWEFYGHWNDDPAKLRADVSYLIG